MRHSKNQTNIFEKVEFKSESAEASEPLVYPKSQKSALLQTIVAVTNRLKILPSYSVQYAYAYYPFGREPQLRPLTNKSRGIVSGKAAKRIRDAMNWLMFFSQKKFVYNKSTKRGYYFKLNFITLTLSSAQHHSDKYILEHLLQPFLRWMQRSHGVVNYIWKAETQENGNIHFHITTNKFIHYKKIAEKWDMLQLSNGYINAETYEQFLLQSPSTQIKSVRNDAQIISYMVKYLAKNEEERKSVKHQQLLKFVQSPMEYQLAMSSITAVGVPFVKRKVTCKVWGCNYSLSRIQCTLTEADENFWNDKREFTERFCKHIKSEKHFTLWRNQLKRDEEIPLSIREKFDSAWEVFNTNDDGIVKYYVN